MFSFLAHDRGIADIIMEDVAKKNKVNVIHAALPYEINATSEGKKLVKWRSQKKDSNEEAQDGIYLNFNYLIVCLKEFDTVIFAIGRVPNTRLLNLDKIGVKTHPSSKKVTLLKSYY